VSLEPERSREGRGVGSRAWGWEFVCRKGENGRKEVQGKKKKATGQTLSHHI